MLAVVSYLATVGVCAAQQMTTESDSTPAFAIGWNPSQIQSVRVPYSDGTSDLSGYLAYDNITAEPRPGVVILPDWDGERYSPVRSPGACQEQQALSRRTNPNRFACLAGIGPYEEWRAHLLATLGYTGHS